ncbi:S24 family peptidase [Legionella pneumophila serogroup 1]|uniref:LexA family protein n=1 Tax=Legionella pneumophila TaxID=446 RepID=UPI0009B3CD48|nr:S24 family peptidase [Legionella pneumophila]PQM73264.1 helix-turn-helix domain-containing protein [Legionella pneumophila]HAT6933095.1 helix-turn-helix domain-containing protein [Legionella pneumophila]HAT7744802.1 helix-turn-helix domain-containing protein [Legionella pneumophila]HAT7820629.1 helix-turn-helix domain-containing protein [Legionella pneumophila]HAT7931020.1 helix-turn-helix domain-containing protein [Legionella pneumophila]
MTELNIKKEIGKRILEARKAKGLTLKALGELAGGLKQTRLTNWEQGVRTPGPEEIKSLAQALDVSPAYLMCLSDTSQSRSTNNPSQLIPLLDHRQACDAPLYLNMIREHKQSDDVVYISVSTALLPELSANAFALKMVDESMIPEIRVNDVLIVSPDVQPRPGDFVVALLESEQIVIVRKYKQLSASRDVQQYELVALNEDWADIRVDSSDVAAQIIGCGVGLIRSLKN